MLLILVLLLELVLLDELDGLSVDAPSGKSPFAGAGVVVEVVVNHGETPLGSASLVHNVALHL